MPYVKNFKWKHFEVFTSLNSSMTANCTARKNVRQVFVFFLLWRKALFFFLLLPLTIRELVDASQLLTRCKKKKKSRLDLRREGGNGKWFLVIRGRCCLAVGKHPWTILKRLCFSLAVVPLARRQEMQYECFCVCVCEFGHVRSWNVLIFISVISRLFNCGEFVLNHVK